MIFLRTKLRIVETQAILFLKTMSEIVGSNIEWLWIWIIQSILGWSKNSSFYFRVVVCRNRLFPTMISKIKWLGCGLPLRFRSVTVKNDDPRNSLYITIFVVSKKLEYGSRVVQKSNYQKQQKVWRNRFEMVLSWQNWQNLLRQMLNSEYLTKNWIISTNMDSTSVTQIILMLLDGAWKKLRKFLTHF